MEIERLTLNRGQTTKLDNDGAVIADKLERDARRFISAIAACDRELAKPSNAIDANQTLRRGQIMVAKEKHLESLSAIYRAQERHPAWRTAHYQPETMRKYLRILGKKV